MSELQVEISRRNPAGVVVALIGSVGVGTGDVLQAHVKHLIAARPKLVVWDLARLGFVTSVGITAMLELHQALKADGGHVVIAGASGNVREVLKRQNIDDVMPLFATVNDALKSGAAAPPDR